MKTVAIMDAETPAPPKGPHSVVSSLWGLIGASIFAMLAGWAICGWLDRITYDLYPGTLHAERNTVLAGRTARLVECHVAAGQSVSEGQKLFRLSDEQLQVRISAKRREVQEVVAECQQLSAKADLEIESRRREIDAEIFQTRLKMAAFLQDKLNRQVEHLAWEEQLSKIDQTSGTRPFLSNRDSPDDRRIRLLLQQDSAATAAETLAAQIELCEQRLKTLQKTHLEMAEKIRTSSGVDVADFRRARVQSELEHLELQENKLTVTSPAFGTVANFHRHPGDLVGENDAVVELLDPERRHVLLDVPSRDVADIKLGQTVFLQFGNWMKRTGRIVEIPPVAQHVDRSRPDSLVPIRIEQIGQDWPSVPAGSTVTARVPK